MSVNNKTWLAVALAAFFSWVGVNKIIQITKEYSAHQQAIADVQGIINENTDINNLTNFNSLKLSQTKIKHNIEKLKKVPNLPIYPYQNAQNQISQLNQLLINLELRIKVEKEASENLQVALQLDDEAAKIVKDKSYSNNWQEARNKWQQAINLLQKIPAGTYVSDTAKQGILAIQRNFDDVGKVIADEEKFFQDFSTAVELAQKAASLTTDSTSITLPDLLNAKSQWQQAINLLVNVSSATSLSLKAQSQLSNYRDNYRQVSNAIDEIKKCTSQNLSSETLCTSSISLDINPPETLTALLEDLKKEEDAKNNQIASSDSSNTSGTSWSKTSDDSSSSNYSGYSSGYSGGSTGTYSRGSVYVHGYTRSDGTYVRGHSRSSPGSRFSGFGSSRSGGAHS